MAYYASVSRPPVQINGVNSSRSSSLTRYSSPVRSNYVTSNRARSNTPLESYITPTNLTLLQVSPNSSCRSSRSSLSRTLVPSREPSFSREPPPEATDFSYNGRRSLRSSLSSSRSRRSSLSRDSPAPSQKHVHFNDNEKGVDTTSSLMSNRRTTALDPMQRIDRKIDSDVRMKYFVRERYPSASSDACRRRQARAAYLSALDNAGFRECYYPK